jgi:hypothetical protein
MINDETKNLLDRYLDNELTGPALADIEQQINDNDDYGAYLREQRALKETLQAAFKNIDERPLQAQLLAHINTDQQLAEATNVIAINKQTRKQPRWFMPTAVAASVVSAFFLGVFSTKEPGNDIGLAHVDDKTAEILNTVETAGRTEKITIHASYLNEAQDFCRAYTQSTESSSYEVLSCRNEQNKWQVQVLTPSIPDDAYQLAGPSDPVGYTLYPGKLVPLDTQQETTYLN